jgi:nucleoside-diphosphate-sugar epimerase
VTPTFVWQALHREALPVENGGIAERDFIFVEDIARGLIACALEGEPGEVYNIASGTQTPILQLAEQVNRLVGNSTPIALKPARDWDRSGKRFGDPTKAKEKLGFVAEVGLDDGLERTIRWTRANRETILRCMTQHVRFVPDVRRYSTQPAW